MLLLILAEHKFKLLKQFLTLLLVSFIFSSCQNERKQTEEKNTNNIEYVEISNPEYELLKPNQKPKAVLLLFGGYPEVAKDIKAEFKILEKAKEQEIALIYSNFNQKIWLEKNELEALAIQVKGIFADNNLPTDNIYFGGFSSGGNVSLLLGNYLKSKKELNILPKGIFIVDSPIELTTLYFNVERNIERNFSEPSVQESNWIIETFNKRFGDPTTHLEEYEKYAVFTLQTENITNIKNLKNTKIRMYTEPDTLWWKENRRNDYEDLNAYYIKKLYEELKEHNFTKVEYIPTENKGYRVNGERHPHSWSIVEVGDLIDWILED